MEEKKKDLAILRENLAISRREADDAYLLAGEIRKAVSKLQDELAYMLRDISISVGGNTKR